MFPTTKDGGFYAAEDADSFPLATSQQKKEGAFCVWTQREISSLLSSPLPSSPSSTLADIFCHHYGVKAGGNVPSHKVRSIKRGNIKTPCHNKTGSSWGTDWPEYSDSQGVS